MKIKCAKILRREQFLKVIFSNTERSLLKNSCYKLFLCVQYMGCLLPSFSYEHLSLLTCIHLSNVFVCACVCALTYQIPWNPEVDLCWHTLINEASDDCEPVWCDSEDPLFILYTSGSTGKPKVKTALSPT